MLCAGKQSTLLTTHSSSGTFSRRIISFVENEGGKTQVKNEYMKHEEKWNEGAEKSVFVGCTPAQRREKCNWSAPFTLSAESPSPPSQQPFSRIINIISVRRRRFAVMQQIIFPRYYSCRPTPPTKKRSRSPAASFSARIRVRRRRVAGERGRTRVPMQFDVTVKNIFQMFGNLMRWRTSHGKRCGKWWFFECWGATVL